MNRQRFLLPAMVTLTLARGLLLPMSGLSEAEQHLLECSRSPAGWHAGLGPVLPWMVKLSTTAFGEGPFGVRFFAPCLIIAAGWLLWELTRGLFDTTTASWTLLLFQVVPAVNIAATTMTPTTVGLAGSVAALAVLRLALHRAHRWHGYWWSLGAGLLLLFLVDWRFFMLGVAVCASMTLTPRGRRALTRWPVLPVLGGFFLVAILAFSYWNARHDWAGLAPFPRTTPFSWTGLLLHLTVAFSPLLLLACLWALFRSAFQKHLAYHVAFIYAFMWPLVTVEALAWASLPWPACGTGMWLAPACILLAHQSLEYEPAPPRLKVAVRTVVILAAVAQSCWLIRG